MSLPATYDLAIYRGDTFRVQFRLWADAAKTQPYDLTGATAAAEIRKAPGQTPLVSMTCTITTNVIDVSLSAAQSLEVPAAGYWDLQLTHASGDVRTLVAGGVASTRDITASSTTRSLVGARG